jgi:DNA-binding CsgD family transcriptional regulator
MSRLYSIEEWQVIDPQSIRISDVRDLLGLMAQLARLSSKPALWRTTLVNGLARILDMYVVGIFTLQARDNPDAQSITPLPVVCWARPAGAPESAELPEPLQMHLALRKFQNRTDAKAPTNHNSRMKSAVKASERRCVKNRGDVIELLFRDAFPPPLSMADTTYLLYSDEKTSAHSVNPAAVVTLLHSEAHRHFGQLSQIHESHGMRESLPERQRQIVQLLLAGEGEKQIAHQLGLSIHTVHSYIRRLYRRLNVSNRAELFRACYAQANTADPPG